MKKMIFSLIICCVLLAAPLAYSTEWPGWTQIGNSVYNRTDCVEGYLFFTVVVGNGAVSTTQIMKHVSGQVVPIRCTSEDKSKQFKRDNKYD